MFTTGEAVGEGCDGVGENGSATGGTIESALVGFSVDAESSDGFDFPVGVDALFESSCFGIATGGADLADLIFAGATGVDGAGFVNAGAAESDDGVCGGVDFLSRNECIAAMTSGA